MKTGNWPTSQDERRKKIGKERKADGKMSHVRDDAARRVLRATRNRT